MDWDLNQLWAIFYPNTTKSSWTMNMVLLPEESKLIVPVWEQEVNFKIDVRAASNGA